MNPFSTIIIAAAVTIILLRRIYPLFSAALAVLFGFGVCLTGIILYNQGKVLYLGSAKLSLGVFLAIFGAWTLLSLLDLIRRARLKRRNGAGEDGSI